MGNWVSIDFGTCNSAAAIEIDGCPKLVTPNNISYFPTVACVLSKDNIVVCRNAESFKQTHSEYYLQEFKLQIAEPLDCNGVDYRKVIASILQHVKGYAELANNDNTIDKVLLTLPVIYTASDPRKEVMRLAAQDAGFKTIEFMDESKAAAYHYSYISGDKTEGLFLIYDLGGGTFDPALIEIDGNGNMNFVGAMSGEKCGGQYFDAAIYKKAKVECELKRENRWSDYAVCKQLKEELSITQEATVVFSNGREFSMHRDELNGLINDRVRLTLDSCDNMLISAKRSWSDVSQVLLVGGSTSVPYVRQMLKSHLVSHNASNVQIIRSKTGVNGEYSHNYAVCLGGIAYSEDLLSIKASDVQPSQEFIGFVTCNDTIYQLKDGCNTFGRNSSQDFQFDDKHMSKTHFTIEVTLDPSANCYNYHLTTVSTTKPTTVDRLALDRRYAFAEQSISLKEGSIIWAGKTKFIFHKQ